MNWHSAHACGGRDTQQCVGCRVRTVKVVEESSRGERWAVPSVTAVRTCSPPRPCTVTTSPQGGGVAGARPASLHSTGLW